MILKSLSPSLCTNLFVPADYKDPVLIFIATGAPVPYQSTNFSQLIRRSERRRYCGGGARDRRPLTIDNDLRDKTVYMAALEMTWCIQELALLPNAIHSRTPGEEIASLRLAIALQARFEDFAHATRAGDKRAVFSTHKCRRELG